VSRLAGSAITDASEAISIEPSYIKSYYRRGTAKLALGQLKQARTDFRAACQIEPNNKEARSKLNECEKVVVFADQPLARTSAKARTGLGIYFDEDNVAQS